LFWGEVTPTARLKTGAGQSQRLATPFARRVFRPTGRGVITRALSLYRPIALSPYRRIALSPYRRIAVSPTRPIASHAAGKRG
jgi:hypothetical protein